MNKGTLEILLRGAQSLDLETEGRFKYMGRGALQETCAIVLKSAGHLAAIAASEAAGMGQDHDLLEEFLEDLKEVRLDCLGLKLVVY